MLQLESLTTGYKTKGSVNEVSKSLNATLEAGRLTCLLGPNGAGKSTLLRTLCAFQPPIEGRIIVDGRDISAYSPKQLSTKISVVLTDRVEVQGLRVEDLIGMGRSPYTGFWGGLRAEDRSAVDDAIRHVGIEALVGRQIQTLSDGERQKVMIAKALAQDTPIILLDEPTAFLDFPSKVEVMLLLHRIAHEMNRAIFLSTHDLDLALQTADSIWLLSKTLGLCKGTPEQMAAEGKLSQFFPSKNLRFDSKNLRFIITKSTF